MPRQLWIDVRTRLVALFARRRLHARADEELQFHLAMRELRLVESGVPVGEAHARARRELGNATALAEQTLDSWRYSFVDTLIQDVRYGLRTMRRNPGFTLAAILSLALGIGANTAIYSFMDAILVRTLPVKDPESLVILQWSSKVRPPVVRGISGSNWNDAELGRVSPNLPWPAFEALSANHPTLSQVVAFRSTNRITALVHGQGTVVEGLYCTGGFFGALGTSPAAGRLIGPDDDREGVPPVAVASYGFAQRRFGGASEAVARRSSSTRPHSPSSA